MRKHLFAALATGALAGVGITAANAADSLYLAHRFQLELDGKVAYYMLALPHQVYAASLRGDLGDLRVFNSAGEPVPYAFDTPAAAPATPPQRFAARWFPLSSSGVDSGGAPVGLSVAADGSLRAAVAPPPRARRTTDLVDLSHIDKPVAALLVHLRDSSYQGRVSVEASNDLRDWRPLTSVSLLKVSHAGQALVQERIALEDARWRYLRLNWRDDAPNIAAVEAEVCAPTASVDSAVAREWHDAAQVRAGKAPGEYLFETDGAYPVDRLQIDLPQPNTIARVRLQSHVDANAPWHDVTSATLFRLQGKAGEQNSPPLEFAVDADRAWRIMVDMRGGGFGNGLPVVKVGWHPAVLIFVARGSPPFTLGVGNATLAPSATSRTALLLGATPEIRPARLGVALPVAPEVITGDPDSRRRYLLWGALLIAVGTLGMVAWRLARGSNSMPERQDG
jgi:hypothetical protein